MRVAIYIRVSTKDGRQDTQNQRDQLTSFVKAQQTWTLTKTYEDKASGKSSDRESFQQMMSDASNREFDLLLFWSLDRMSREGVLETLVHLKKLSDCGVNFKSLTEQYLDSCGIFRDAVIGILATIAKQERVRLSERTKAGLERVIANGTKGPNGHVGPGRPQSTLDMEEIRKLRKGGLPVAKIAAKYGVSRATLTRALAKRA